MTAYQPPVPEVIESPEVVMPEIGPTLAPDGIHSRRREGNIPRRLFDLIDDYSEEQERIPGYWTRLPKAWQWTAQPLTDDQLDRWIRSGCVFHAGRWVY